MKKLKAIYTLGILLIANLSFAQNFEGVITMNTSNAEMKEDATVTWYLKDNRTRLDIRSTADGHDSEYAIIADEKGMHMISQGHVTDVPQTAMKVDLATQTLVSEKDGVTMNGHTCKQVVYTDGKNQTIYWLTTELDIEFNDIPFVIKRNMPKINTTGFPIKMEKRDAEGKVVLSQDVVSVTSTEVKESRFERN